MAAVATAKKLAAPLKKSGKSGGASFPAESQDYNLGSMGYNPPKPAPQTQSLYRGGGGGGGAAAAAPAAPRQTFDQFLAGNPLYTMAMGESGRQLQDFDAETLRMQQETEQQQALQRAALQRSLADMANTGQGALNARGIGRSGLAFQQQDKTNQYGVEQSTGIDQLLTALLGQRTSGRLAVEQQNRQAQNTLIEQLLSQFNGGQVIG